MRAPPRSKVRALLLAVLVLAAIPPAALAKPPVWIIRDKDSEIVLFGSLHLLPPGVDWRPAALAEALGKADDLWFELPLDTATAGYAQRQAQANSQLPPGQKLTALLSVAGRDRLARLARRIGAPLDALDRLQPWYAETALGVAVLRQEGALSEQGVERQVAAAAAPTVTRRAFETADQQIALFARGSQAEQVRSLELSLRELEDDPGYTARLVKMWLNGDVRGLDREVVAKVRREEPALYRRLIVERNRAWTPLILERLAGSGRTVMVVGVGHLVGPDGLPALLRARGVTVEGP